jgi:hypothetical protein
MTNQLYLPNSWSVLKTKEVLKKLTLPKSLKNPNANRKYT